MRIAIGIVILALVALVGYNYLTTGEIRVVPQARSADEITLDRLQARFETARRKLVDAESSANAAGERAKAGLKDEMEAARRQLDDVKTQVDGFLERTGERAASGKNRLAARLRDKATRLRAAIDAFRRELKR
jgi:predicted  nucleic acid-binding Zn-ribbon protein